MSENYQEPPRTNQEHPSQAQSASPAVAGSAEKPSSSRSSASRSARGEKIPSLISEAGLDFADWFRSTLRERVSLAKRWREEWARAFDDLVRIDLRTHDEIWWVSNWARADSFWAKNFLTPLKLRKRNKEGITYFDYISEQMLNGSKAHRKPSPPAILHMNHEHDRAEIIAANPLPNYCQARGWQLRKDGPRWKCLCPLHCGVGGSVIDLTPRSPVHTGCPLP
jgi:hypothetical protein